MKRTAWIFLGLAVVSGVAPAAHAVEGGTVRVAVGGAVHRAASFELPADARFADALLAAAPTSDAYVLGAAVFRQEARAAQAARKAGLLYELDSVLALPDAAPALLDQASRLKVALTAMPVTGRVVNPLEPRRLEVDLDANRPLADGDRFFFPQRPTDVRITGAVLDDCKVAHVPQRDARDYLPQCGLHATADREQLLVIQPDGQVQQLGVAVWNRSQPQALAPGAVLYVPLGSRQLDRLAPTFNHDLATFIGTQVATDNTLP